MPTVEIPSILQWVGAAKETTYGTPVAAPTVWIPVDPGSLKFKPNLNMLTDKFARGLMGADYQQVAGMRYDTLQYKTYPYMDSIYQHFLAVLGNADTVTGSSDPWTHKTSLYNGSGTNQAQPSSWTLFFFDGLQCWQIPGCMLTNLKTTVKVDDLVSLEPTWTGLKAAQIATPANTPTTVKPWPSWNAGITFAGSAANDYSEIVVEYKRDADAVRTINASQVPLAILQAQLAVAISGTAVYQGGANDLRAVDYLANTQPTINVKLAPAGDAVHSLTLQHTVCAFDSVDPQGSNKWMEIPFTAKALMNATDALDGKQSPAQVIFLTATSTAF